MKKANPKTVGGFVIGAVILAVAAVGVFGGGRFFEERKTYVAFFPGSLMGLRIGAPVEMRGIQIGTVTDVWVEVDPESLEFMIPVLMEIELSRIRGASTSEEAGDRVHELIDKGLRVQLAAQSLVTGQQSIQMDFQPDSPAKLVETDLPYPQFPTIPSKFAEIESELGDVVDRAGVVLAQVSDLLSDKNRAKVGESLENVADATGKVEKAVDELKTVIADVGAIVQTVKTDIPEFQQLRETAEQTLVSYKALAERADGMLAANEDGVKKAISGLRETENKISALAEQAAKLIEANQKGIGDFANTGLYEFTNLAVDAQATVEQLRRVLEEMERDPARYFLGRPGEVEVQ
ncbi:MAG: MlaD family protein [Rhodospirillales bacterium]|nr:MlaD family protein [Rhodospirillales bacterium]MDH3967047.1 MlaD family protein [Rhodospirillales bacterium]